MNELLNKGTPIAQLQCQEKNGLATRIVMYCRNYQIVKIVSSTPWIMIVKSLTSGSLKISLVLPDQWENYKEKSYKCQLQKNCNALLITRINIAFILNR